MSGRLLRAKTVDYSPVQFKRPRAATPLLAKAPRPSRSFQLPAPSPDNYELISDNDEDSEELDTRADRRPKYQLHYAVTMALLNMKKPIATKAEIFTFIARYIPGWSGRRPYLPISPFYDKLKNKSGVSIKPGIGNIFKKRMIKMMAKYPDRNSWEYGLNSGDDWEDLISGEFSNENGRTHVPYWLPARNDTLNEEERKTEKTREAQQIRNSNELDIRWILDLAVLYNGNSTPAVFIFDFVTKNFPEYRNSHQWKSKLSEMVVLKRIIAVQGELDWTMQYVVVDKEIEEFYEAIEDFLGDDTSTTRTANGLSPDVKWDEILPFKLLTTIAAYLRGKRVNQKRRRHHNLGDHDSTNVLKSKKAKRSKPNRAITGINSTISSTEPFRTFPNPHTARTERAARLVRRHLSLDGANRPVYSVPNPNLPRQARLVSVEADAMVPIDNGEFENVEEREMASPFAGLFIPREFLTMSTDLMKALPQESDEIDNNDEDIPSDLRGIEFEGEDWTDDIAALGLLDNIEQQPSPPSDNLSTVKLE